MPSLQATMLPDNSIFFWSISSTNPSPADAGLAEALRSAPTASIRLANPAATPRRIEQDGVVLTHQQALDHLIGVPHDTASSDSIRVLARVCQFAAELVIHMRVVPTVSGSSAHWKALLTRDVDQQRFDQLVRSIPVACRCHPTEPSGAVRLLPAQTLVRRFLDATVDRLMRRNAYPGTARGWPLEFAESLRGPAHRFEPRDARNQGVPARLRAWSDIGADTGLRLIFELGLPEQSSGPFSLFLSACTADRPGEVFAVQEAFDGAQGAHAYSLLQALARASSVYPPLSRCLADASPRNLSLTRRETFDLLTTGVPALRSAGFRVDLPPAFEEAGSSRLQARMCLTTHADGELPDLDGALDFRWEITIGSRVIDGPTFERLCASGEPIVPFDEAWVILDPAQLARLPDNLRETGQLSSAEALRAVLTGTHDGVPVRADSRLHVVLEALRNPPDEPVPSALNATLRPYQQRGLSWLTTLGRLGLGACLADDMGLGKTIQVIAHILARRPGAAGPSLVVCPTSVLGNWENELARFAPTLQVTRYHGNARDEETFHTADVVLTTYGLLARDVELLAQTRWDVLALDEAQAIKNPDSQRARAARCIPAKHRVALSGTPVENRLLELWSLLEFLIPGLLGPRNTFKREVAIPVERFGDAQAAEQLRLGVSPFVLRRLKTDPTVIDDLPDKLERRAWASLTDEQSVLYREVVDDCMQRIEGADGVERRGNVLAMLTALKQVCNHPAQYLGETGPLDRRSGKLDRVTALLGQILEAGERALVFTQYRVMGDLLQRHIADHFGLHAPFLHGGVSAHKRQEMVDAFQEGVDASPILLISLRAGGTGLNLTQATHVIHYDRWWNPAVEDQATDRAYRIGQRRDVLVHKMVTADTLEQRIDALLDDKRALAESVVATGERWVAQLDDEALRRLVMLGGNTP